ncbi:hypothetical protein ATL10_11111, partial [Bacillus sp. 196mf]
MKHFTKMVQMEDQRHIFLFSYILKADIKNEKKG